MSHLTYLLFLANCLVLSECSRILLIPAHNVPSHTKSMYIIGEVLKNAGHNVSVLQLVEDPINGAASTKIGIIDRVIAISQPGNSSRMLSIGNMPWIKSPSISYMFYQGWKMSSNLCVQILSNEPTRLEFEWIMNEGWDAIIIDNFTPICALAALQQIQPKPVLVDFATMLLFKKCIKWKGAFVPTSLDAIFDQPDFDLTKFTHRLKSHLHNIQLDWTHWILDHMVPYWTESVGLGNIGLSRIHGGSSFAVTSVPNGLDYTQPRTLDLAEFDNTCSKDSNLPDPFQTVIDDPNSKGTILFAMGHFVDWNFAPEYAIAAFVRAFARYPDYRIIWQFNGNRKPENLTSNVLLHKWVPQAAILNHPKTKLFISHMGYKSMREAICARVPILAVPMFGDQERNTAMAQYRGYAVYLSKWTLSSERVYEKIKLILDDEQYEMAVRRVQDQMEDKLRNISDLFTFQLEFFMRHNEEDIMNKYIRNKWSKLSVISRSGNVDAALPWLFLIGFFSMLIF